MTRVKALYRSEAIPFVAVSRSVHCAIVLSGSSRSANRAYAGGQSFTTSNWMH
jgi:hypothetical protein